MSQDITRRSFLSKSSKGLMAMGMVPYFLKSDLNRAFAKATGDKNMNFYFDHFGVNETMIRDVMSEALSRGGRGASAVCPGDARGRRRVAEAGSPLSQGVAAF